MTNGEKFKTAHEREEAFRDWCKIEIEDGCLTCPLRNCTKGMQDCAFAWLDLEAEDEKTETIEEIAAELRSEPLGEGGAKPWLHYLADRIIAAHNRVAKAAMAAKESEVKE